MFTITDIQLKLSRRDWIEKPGRKQEGPPLLKSKKKKNNVKGLNKFYKTGTWLTDKTMKLINSYSIQLGCSNKKALGFCAGHLRFSYIFL
jgi:hypothetical protein